ncbi:MAG: bifunctional diaminohydroxyphosphoribosylaminopyrimidine deaminase/5-amino-6-(5-phosphoribosylamino)uracil reductase RibD [Nocardioidaceae bacterium]
MAPEVEFAAMRRALDLALTADAPLGPNPRVGCVLLDPAGEIVGTGFHRGAGTAHAEVVALEAAGSAAKGATAVITLEPCSHIGRTGPCTQALIDAGVSRVVFGQTDDSPLGSGGGDALRAVGVEVEGGLLADEAAAVNPAWSLAVRNRRPFVTWKFAATLDGRSAAADGSSQWITSLAARQDVHRLRAACDAVVVGTGTVLADDPWLTVRDSAGVPLAEQPLRVVVGRRQLPVGSRVLDDTAETLLLRTREPSEVMCALFARDRLRVWLEGGPRLAGAFLRAGLVDEVVAYVAPVLLGAGRHALDDAGISTISDAIRLGHVDFGRVGPDLRIIAHTRPRAPQQEG